MTRNGVEMEIGKRTGGAVRCLCCAGVLRSALMFVCECRSVSVRVWPRSKMSVCVHQCVSEVIQSIG